MRRILVALAAVGTMVGLAGIVAPEAQALPRPVGNSLDSPNDLTLLVRGRGGGGGGFRGGFRGVGGGGYYRGGGYGYYGYGPAYGYGPSCYWSPRYHRRICSYY